ncbi:MAG: ABC transporter substrate-binding protein [Halohasta sp.]
MSYEISRRTTLKGIGAASVTTALAGCTGGDGGSGPDVRVGVLQPATGDLGNLGAPIQDAGALPGIQLENEGVDYEIEIRREDTETDPNIGIERAQALADAGFPSVTGAASSGVTVAVAEDVFIPQEVVGISPASTSPAITEMNGDYLLRTCPSDALQTQAIADIAYNDEGAETASTFYLNNDYGQGLNDAFVENFEEQGGEVFEEVAFEAEQPSYDSPLGTALGDEPDMLLIVGYPASGEQILRDYYESYDTGATIFVTDGLQDNDLPSNVDNSLDNVVGTAPSATGPGADTYADLYEEEFGGSPGVFTAQAYDATVVHILAQLRAGELSGSAVSAEIRAVANPDGEEVGPDNLAEAVEMAANGDEIQYQGASSAIVFDENGDLNAVDYEVFEFDSDGYTTVDQYSIE